MGVTQYIGARYVPMFADPAEWTKARTYEPLTIVLHEGNSYTSRQFVPVGIELTNEDFWLETGNYNAQVEAYRQEVRTFDNRITTNTNNITALGNELDTFKDQTAQNFADEQTARTQAINAEKLAREEADTALNNAINAEKLAREEAITAEQTARTQAVNAEKTAREQAIGAEKTAREAADEHLQNELDALQKVQNVRTVRLSQVGIVRNPSNRNNASDADNRRAQGFCFDGENFIMALSNTNSTNAKVFKRGLNDSSFTIVGERPFEHASDIIFIPETNEYWVSSGDNGKVFICNASSLSVTDQFVVGTSAPLLAYDKVTGKVYLNDYWGALYEINPATRQATIIKQEFISNMYKQSIAAHDGVIYTLFSFQTSIVCYDIAQDKYTEKMQLIGDNLLPLYEVEGIDTSEDGTIYVSAYTASAWNSVTLNPIYVIETQPTLEAVNDGAYRANCFVISNTQANRLANQKPDGTANNPFVTIDEALLYLALHPQINQIVVSGSHTDEHMFITMPVTVNGQADESMSKPKIGRIYTTGSFLFVYNVEFAPSVDVPDFISGYRNGPISMASVSKSGNHSTPTSGHDYQSQYPINTTFVNNGDFA